MSLQVIVSDSIGAGVRVDLTTVDDAYVAKGVTVISTDDAGVFGNGSGQSVHVDGTVSGTTGIRLGNGPQNGTNSVYVGLEGVVRGQVGVAVRGTGANIENYGQIAGASFGIVTSSSGLTTADSVVLNFGSIVGGVFGVYREDQQETRTLTLKNSGTIIGGQYSYHAGFAPILDIAKDIIINTGTMTGDIVTNGGNDRYIGHNGLLVGDIDLDKGNDRLDSRGGKITGIVNGGDGRDTLLLGAGGNRIIGGEGKDTIAGGEGNDVFAFGSLTDLGDKITDFSNKPGNNDQLLLNDAPFGLPVGPLAASRFHAGNTNHAGDANDRFVFRTTDRTLWFDADGTGSGAAVLIADLQAGAVVTAADIFIW